MSKKTDYSVSIVPKILTVRTTSLLNVAIGVQNENGVVEGKFISVDDSTGTIQYKESSAINMVNTVESDPKKGQFLTSFIEVFLLVKSGRTSRKAGVIKIDVAEYINKGLTEVTETKAFDKPSEMKAKLHFSIRIKSQDKYKKELASEESKSSTSLSSRALSDLMKTIPPSNQHLIDFGADIKLTQSTYLPTHGPKEENKHNRNLFESQEIPSSDKLKTPKDVRETIKTIESVNYSERETYKDVGGSREKQSSKKSGSIGASERPRSGLFQPSPRPRSPVPLTKNPSPRTSTFRESKEILIRPRPQITVDDDQTTHKGKKTKENSEGNGSGSSFINSPVNHGSEHGSSSGKIKKDLRKALIAAEKKCLILESEKNIQESKIRLLEGKLEDFLAQSSYQMAGNQSAGSDLDEANEGYRKNADSRSKRKKSNNRRQGFDFEMIKSLRRELRKIEQTVAVTADFSTVNFGRVFSATNEFFLREAETRNQWGYEISLLKRDFKEKVSSISTDMSIVGDALSTLQTKAENSAKREREWQGLFESVAGSLSIKNPSLICSKESPSAIKTILLAKINDVRNRSDLKESTQDDEIKELKQRARELNQKLESERSKFEEEKLKLERQVRFAETHAESLGNILSENKRLLETYKDTLEQKQREPSIGKLSQRKDDDDQMVKILTERLNMTSAKLDRATEQLEAAQKQILRANVS